MKEIIKSIALYVAYFAEIAAAIVIVIGALQAIWIYLRWVFTIKSHFQELTQSRLKLGHSLSLGLGFLIGADIIKSAVAPSWSEIGILGAVVAIRIILNFFLMRDLKEWEKESNRQKDS